MWLMGSQELVAGLYVWMTDVFLSSESLPPTAMSCPCSETHVDKVTGVSSSFCQTLVLPLFGEDKALSRNPRDCDWQDWKRASSEQVKTDLDFPFS